MLAKSGGCCFCARLPLSRQFSGRVFSAKPLALRQTGFERKLLRGRGAGEPGRLLESDDAKTPNYLRACDEAVRTDAAIVDSGFSGHRGSDPAVERATPEDVYRAIASHFNRMAPTSRQEEAAHPVTEEVDRCYAVLPELRAACFEQIENNRRAAARAANERAPIELPLCPPPHRLTARDGCQWK
jgi:hypothetical protein